MRSLPYIFLLAFLFNIAPSICQTSNRIDSLMVELNNTVNSKTKVKIQKQLFDSYLRVSLDSAKTYLEKILSVKTENEVEQAEIYLLASKYQYYRYNLDSSKYYTKKVNEIAKKIHNDSLLADSHLKLGILNAYQNKPEEEEFHRTEALRVARLMNDWKLVGRALTGLANQYYLREDLSNATKFYLSADSTYKLNNYNGEEAAMVYENLSRIYMNRKDEKSLQYANQAESFYLAQGNNIGLARSYSVKGQYYLHIMGNPAGAIPFFEKAYKIQSEHGALKELSTIENNLLSAYSANKDFEKGVALLNTIEKKNQGKSKDDIQVPFNFYSAGGQLYADMGEYEKSAKYLEEALKLDNIDALLLRDFSLKSVYEVLSDVHYNLGNYKRSSELKEMYIKLSDSLNRINQLDLSKELEAKYQSEQKEKEIELLQAQNEAVEALKTNQRNLLLGGIGITTFAGIFMFLLFRNRQKTNKKLLELDTAKSNFFANISHELRTPLALIATPIQSKLEQKDLAERERKEYEMILRNNNRLTDLVDQLLDLSKLESGNLKLKVTEVPASSFLEAQLEPYRYLAASKDLHFEGSLDIKEETLWIDREAIQKILSNLLSNAIKYCSVKGSVKGDFKTNSKGLGITIKNSADPLTKLQKEQLFNRFYQANEFKEGAGIGLALVKELVELHKGKITVDDEEGFVSFQVTLPCHKGDFDAEELTEGRKIVSETNLPERNFGDSAILEEDPIDTDESLPLLLLVEDNPDLRTVLKQTFKKDYRIVVATNGEEGTEKAIAQVPDLIISDIMMPKKNGVALTKELKNHELTSHIPIILLTAKAGDENELTGIDSGADDYITKPFNNALLKSKMTNLLETRKKMRARYSQEVILKPQDIAVTPADELLLERIQTVLDTYLLEASFSTEDFAKELGFSRMQLHRKLKALTGLSATEFIRSQRLKLAAQLLENSEANVSEVCYQTGFNNLSYFAKCFKEAYGVSPSQYPKKA